MQLPFMVGGPPVDTDDTLSANSDSRIPSQRAVRAYVLANAGGGGGGSTYSEVANYAALPSAAANSGTTYLVRASQGVYFVNRKPKGLYRSNGTTWERLDDETEAYFQDSLAWSMITSKPAEFPPEDHTHPLADITDAGTAAALDVPVSGDAASGEVVKGNDSRLTNARTPSAHTHAIADTTGLQSALDGKLATSAAAADVNPAGTSIAAALSGKLGTSGTAADVNPAGAGIAAALATKAASSHTHNASDINAGNLAALRNTLNVPRSVSGTSDTLQLVDAWLGVEYTSGSAVALTIPPNSSVAFPVGVQVPIFIYGAGQVTVSGGSGVTLRTRGGANKSAGQYAMALLWQRAADEWLLTGDLTT